MEHGNYPSIKWNTVLEIKCQYYDQNLQNSKEICEEVKKTALKKTYLNWHWKFTRNSHAEQGCSVGCRKKEDKQRHRELVFRVLNNRNLLLYSFGGGKSAINVLTRLVSPDDNHILPVSLYDISAALTSQGSLLLVHQPHWSRTTFLWP